MSTCREEPLPEGPSGSAIEDLELKDVVERWCIGHGTAHAIESAREAHRGCVITLHRWDGERAMSLSDGEMISAGAAGLPRLLDHKLAGTKPRHRERPPIDLRFVRY